LLVTVSQDIKPISGEKFNPLASEGQEKL
jgi:hypothetical protein